MASEVRLTGNASLPAQPLFNEAERVAFLADMKQFQIEMGAESIASLLEGVQDLEDDQVLEGMSQAECKAFASEGEVLAKALAGDPETVRLGFNTQINAKFFQLAADMSKDALDEFNKICFQVSKQELREISLQNPSANVMQTMLQMDRVESIAKKLALLEKVRDLSSERSKAEIETKVVLPFKQFCIDSGFIKAQSK